MECKRDKEKKQQKLNTEVKKNHITNFKKGKKGKVYQCFQRALRLSTSPSQCRYCVCSHTVLPCGWCLDDSPTSTLRFKWILIKCVLVFYIRSDFYRQFQCVEETFLLVPLKPSRWSWPHSGRQSSCSHSPLLLRSDLFQARRLIKKRRIKVREKDVLRRKIKEEKRNTIKKRRNDG